MLLDSLDFLASAVLDCNPVLDSPTGSLIAFYLTLAFAAQAHWCLRGYDAASAFLQYEGISRTLLLRMPSSNPPPGTLPGQILRALGSTYGTKDAGRIFYKTLGRCALKVGLTERRLC